MTPDMVLEVIELYRAELDSLGIGSRDHPHGLPAGSGDEILEHCRGMLDKVVGFVEEGQMDKVFRWLGFVQGCLWAQGVFTIGQMAEHNRPPE